VRLHDRGFSDEERGGLGVAKVAGGESPAAPSLSLPRGSAGSKEPQCILSRPC
jgi:hypothetical protein